MWKARKVRVADLERILNELEYDGWKILSASPVAGYEKFDMVVVAQKSHRLAYKSLGEVLYDNEAYDQMVKDVKVDLRAEG